MVQFPMQMKKGKLFRILMNSGHSVDTPISDKGYILWNIEILWIIHTLLILKDNDSCWSILGTYEYLTKRAIPSGIDVTFVDCNNIPGVISALKSSTKVSLPNIHKL